MLFLLRLISEFQVKTCFLHDLIEKQKICRKIKNIIHRKFIYIHMYV